MIQKKRHLAKAITWRFISSLTTFIIAYMITGDFGLGVSITSVDIIIKIILYYNHERLWYKTKWGIK